MSHSHRQLREIFHLLFLSRLLKVADPALFVLKGGVNLRFFFKSPRYSEDMDLDALGGAVATLRKNGYAILDSQAFRRSLHTYGIADIIVNDPEKAKHTGTTQRFRLQLVTEANERLPTKVEFSRRGAKEDFLREAIDPSIVRPYKQLSFSCQHYAAKVAAHQKIQALANRAAAQARDVFDLYILRLGGHVSAHDMELSGELRERAAEQLLSMDFTDYSGQVLEFLEVDDRERYGSEDAWGEMRDCVFELLEGVK